MKVVKLLFNTGILIMGVVVIALIAGFGLLLGFPLENHNFDEIIKVLDLIVQWGSFAGKYLIIASFIYLMFHIIEEYDKEMEVLKKQFDFEKKKEK